MTGLLVGTTGGVAGGVISIGADGEEMVVVVVTEGGVAATAWGGAFFRAETTSEIGRSLARELLLTGWVGEF
jgi:hypothetical protein